MIDSESLGGFGDRLTNQLTDGRTFVNVESLSRLKNLLTSIVRLSAKVSINFLELFVS